MTLPEPDTHCWDEDTGQDVWSFSKGQVDQMLAERDAAIQLMRRALDELARLGNGAEYGNSDGNCIAIAALAATERKT